VTAQSFTVGQTGVLTGIDVFVAQEIPEGQNAGGLELGLFSLVSGEVPAGADPLATATIDKAVIPDISVDPPDVFSFTPFFVDLSSANVAVTAGDMLAFSLTRIVEGDIYFAQSVTPGSYEDGIRLSLSPDGDLVPLFNVDLTFRTYVDTAGGVTPPEVIPLPAGFPLMLAAIGAFAVIRRRASAA
jgi:hypothetical protein